MAKEWCREEDGSFVASLFSLQKEIQTLATCGREANARLNIRELIAPMLFMGVSPLAEETLFSMLRSILIARQSLDVLSEKLSLLASELSLVEGGGVSEWKRNGAI